MEKVELGISEPSQFPPYRRSHLRSQTYHTLVRIISHLSASTTHSLNVPDNGSGRMGQEIQEKEPECSEFVSSGFMDPKDPVPKKEEILEVHETIDGVGDKVMDFSANMIVLDDLELMMGLEETSTQADGFNMEQRLMDELELVVKGTEDLVCDSGLIPLNSGLDDKQNGGSEVELMDYQVQHSDVNTSENASKLQVRGELNQLASQGFHPSLMFNVDTSTMGQASTISTSSIMNGSQQKETALVKSVCGLESLPTTEEGEFEKEEQCGQKVAEAMQTALDLDIDSEELNMSGDGGLLDSAILKEKHEMRSGEELDKLVCVNNAINSSNILIEKEDVEEGEISGDFGMADNSFDMSSADSLILQQVNVDEVQKPKNRIENVEPRTSDKNGIAFGTKVAISRETNKCDKAGQCVSVLKPDNSKDRHIGSKGINEVPTNLTQNQVLRRGSLEENATKDHVNSSAAKKMVDVSEKKKRGPGSEEKKDKKKAKKRKKRAEENRKQGVKRMKLLPVLKPKTVMHCRHYLKGRCHEGDKCHFSHDTVPLTKSTPCSHFTRGKCLKGDDCPFDHQLSKYPCNNFVSKGSCIRGYACMFSHQVPAKQDIPTPSNVSIPELKSPHPSGNINLNITLNNHGSFVQQNHFTNSSGTHSHINAEHKVADTVQKQPTRAPKGISFINVAKLSLSPNTPKQGVVTQNKESLVQSGTRSDQSISGKTPNTLEIPKKFSAVTPKGINFLSFGKGPVCSFKSSISSLVMRENGVKFPQLVNFGLPEQASSLNKDDHSKVSEGTKQNVPQTDLFSKEISDTNQSVAEGMKFKFPGNVSTDDSTTDLRCSLLSNRDHKHSKSVQEGKKTSDDSRTSNVTSSMLLVSPFVSRQYSERLVSGYHKQASNSGQRAFLSTLEFAAEHESDIKMKCCAGASPV
ncbi:uncharacterized protein LOC133307426 [Gastrolobium bilobum]|uniref:uncharacterized protein LOC133307426 n=1 Tax=Gastrolobium bilobum TaxID=150636 RepID=UPI002AB09442|nr:uncharacterized protein LOC133307426 [Gastrolobium bilobum]